MGIAGGAASSGAEQHRAVELLLAGSEVQQQLQYLVHYLVDPRVGAVHLVDHHHQHQSQLKGLGEHESGLGHRALSGVHQKQHAVRHLEHALDLPAEICVTGGVYDIDLYSVVGAGAVLGKDGYPPLSLQVAGVHDPVGDDLVLPERAALPEHLVDQRGLAVVDVSDYCYVS